MDIIQSNCERKGISEVDILRERCRVMLQTVLMTNFLWTDKCCCWSEKLKFGVRVTKQEGGDVDHYYDDHEVLTIPKMGKPLQFLQDRIEERFGGSIKIKNTKKLTVLKVKVREAEALKTINIVENYYQKWPGIRFNKRPDHNVFQRIKTVLVNSEIGILENFYNDFGSSSESEDMVNIEKEAIFSHVLDYAREISKMEKIKEQDKASLELLRKSLVEYYWMVYNFDSPLYLDYMDSHRNCIFTLYTDANLGLVGVCHSIPCFCPLNFNSIIEAGWFITNRITPFSVRIRGTIIESTNTIGAITWLTENCIYPQNKRSILESK